jgi:hypothetical protein
VAFATRKKPKKTGVEGTAQDADAKLEYLCGKTSLGEEFSHAPFFLAAAAFFRLAQAVFIAIDIFDLNSASSAGGVIVAKSVLFFEGAFFGAAASAFAALIAAQRRFCASAILRRLKH